MRTFKKFRIAIYYLFSLYLIVITFVAIESELLKKIVYYGFLIVTGMSLGVAISAYYLSKEKET